MIVFFFFKQKTAYEMRISDWSSDVCSSDLRPLTDEAVRQMAVRRRGGRYRELPARQLRQHRWRRQCRTSAETALAATRTEPHESRGPAIAFKEQVRVPLQASTTTMRAGTTARTGRRTSEHESAHVAPYPVIFRISRPRRLHRHRVV